MRQQFAIFMGVFGAVLILAASATADLTPSARGAELFATKGCAHCHGPAGVGGGTGPDLQRVRELMDAVAITKQIVEGRGAMPAYGEILTPAETEDLVVFLREKRKLVRVPAKPKTKASPQ